LFVGGKKDGGKWEKKGKGGGTRTSLYEGLILKCVPIKGVGTKPATDGKKGGPFNHFVKGS